ncbi:MAG: hypothetical protein L0Y50_00705 [Beijerinckiaceae bacterium]|nr:hypothetical protein [Beijerinckiaceae bacterium]MCI0734793.1 hypothetical protein [Beijerinckiaceae bacterium]
MQFPIIIAVILVIYIFIVRPKLKQYRAITGIIDTIDTSGLPVWRRFMARLSGYKTFILASLSAIVPQLPPILEELNSFTDWHLFLDGGAAQKISAVLAALTAISHVYGLVTAAKIVPIGASDPAPTE